MDWPKRIYAATKTKGLYAAPMFTASGEQPIWVTVNAGLPSTAISAFCLDRSEVLHDNRMFCVVNQDLYRRVTSEWWEKVLTTEEARSLLGFTHGEYIQHVITDPITGYVYVSLATTVDSLGALGICFSPDHGDTWYGSVICDAVYQYVRDHPIDAHNGMVALMYSAGSPASQHTAYSRDCGLTWTTYPVDNATPANWLPARVQPWTREYYYGCRSGGFHDLLKCSTSTESYTDVDPEDAENGPYSQGGMWFDSEDPLHIITLPGTGDAGQVIVETLDGFATPGTKQTQNTPHTSEVASECDSGFWVFGSGATGAVYVSTDGITLQNRSGASPWAIPANSGGICQWGLWVVMETPSGGPTVPEDGGTFTPPGYESRIWLIPSGSHAQAVSFPDYNGIDRGTPMPGDRGAWDTVWHEELHARDIQDAAPTVHNPTDGNVGDAPVWDGEKYVATDVLTPDEHTAIGNDAPHHAPVTLGASNNAALALSGQELTLTMPAIPNQYRQFTYVPDGAGSWAFVVDENGMPVFASLDTQ